MNGVPLAGASLDGHDAILKANGLALGYGRRVILTDVTIDSVDFPKSVASLN